MCPVHTAPARKVGGAGFEPDNKSRKPLTLTHWKQPPTESIMPSFVITVKDEEVQALLNRLAEQADDLQPKLQAIGDAIVERA